MLFKSLISIKIETESRLHCIAIIAYHRIDLNFVANKLKRENKKAKITN